MDESSPAAAGMPSFPIARAGGSDMNQNPAPSSETSATIARPQPVRRPLDPREVAQALAAIQSDSRRQPETYLRDTVVPHGGE
jgi:hypothetical protein